MPDVNRSVSDFAPVVEVGDDGAERRQIAFGLSAVRNVGAGLVGLLLAEREANGPFADFYDFCERVDFQVLNKKTLESLIKAGAFDSLGHPPPGAAPGLRADRGRHRVPPPRARHGRDVPVRRRRRRRARCSTSGRPIPDVEFAKRERLSFEKEMLGLYVSDHPLMGAEASLRRKCDGTLTDLAEMDDGAVRTFGGVITGLQRKWTRKGDLMAVFALEDLQTAVEVMVFPKTMTDHGHKLADDAVVVVRARVDTREDQPKLIAMDVEPFEPMSGEAFPLRVKVAASTGLGGPDRRAEAAAQRVPGGLAGVPPPGRTAGPAPARRPGPWTSARPCSGGSASCSDPPPSWPETDPRIGLDPRVMDAEQGLRAPVQSASSCAGAPRLLDWSGRNTE